eukprot:CAMPEP_0119318504 /NCGR_PEP_ID=MMETSP1333-20130426/46653_1 /TAXON_ID=418940 /ORGANISM="Scyphosphaera apsteinii, Strain RCC1455" /LENGTH=352 /DNA_ID=CAMNT_0007324699 /DNA_START=145 /DNA_END=1203 /DNA_ORIENTATION=+
MGAVVVTRTSKLKCCNYPPAPRRPERKPKLSPRALDARLAENCMHHAKYPSIEITYATCSRCVQEWLMQHRAAVLGFDTETRPQFIKGETANAPATLQVVPALMWHHEPSKHSRVLEIVAQLSTASACLVIHLTHCERTKHWLKPLRTLLADPTVLKAGVGIDDDAISLWLHWGFDVNGRLDLGRVGGSNRGLKSLAAEYLGLNLEKSKSLALSDWELRPLSEAQLNYAALDAWVGHALFSQLAAIQPEIFSYHVLQHRLSGQRELAELYARRRVRQAIRAQFITLDKEFSASINENEVSKRRTQQIRKYVTKMRRKLSTVLGTSNDTLRFGQVHMPYKTCSTAATNDAQKR